MKALQLLDTFRQEALHALARTAGLEQERSSRKGGHISMLDKSG